MTKTGLIPLTAERLRDVFDYNEQTGIFTWRISLGCKILPGRRAGSIDENGYIRIGIDGHQVRAHRLVWLYIYGCWPSGGLDHVNGHKDDNRLINLREASQSQNNSNRPIQKNNRSGFKGVCWNKFERRWHAYIQVNNKYIYLGFHKTREAAHAAYCAAAREHHGEFARFA